MTSKKSVYLSLLTSASILVACAPQNGNDVLQAKNLQAPHDMRESFSSVTLRSTIGPSQMTVANSGLSSKDSEYLVIKKGALGKEFLMSASVIPQTESPTSSGLQGRIVTFKKVGHRLFLMESTEGQVISPTLPASLILAEIPIVEDDAKTDSLVIDFNTGMKKVFLAGNWWGSDMSGKAYDSKKRADGIDVDVSYLDSIHNVGANGEILEIRQIAQTSNPQQAQDMSMSMGHPTLEVRYYLRAYEKNPNYVPRESNANFDNVGFFETPPALERVSGRPLVNYTFQDLSKPVTYYISANTPAEFREAIKDGILYWNKAFGKELLKVEIAPTGVTAPDPLHNVVQWVEYDNAGFAYADALMDPRSGEIKHAQVYLTSAFAFASKIRARQLLRLMDADKAGQGQKKDGDKGRYRMFAPFSVKGLGAEALCDYDMSQNIVQVIEAVLSKAANDATLLKISQDYIREVTAHEVGHTLGLRHNFAGNLASTYSQKGRVEAVSKYIAKGELEKADESMTTSSVMEYSDFMDAILNGGLIKARTKAFPYDAKAMNIAYLDRNAKPDADNILFCTDSQISEAKNGYMDCQPFDSGANPLEYIAATIQDKLNHEAYRFVETFLTAKSNVVEVDRLPVEKVIVRPDSASAIGTLTAQGLQWMTAEVPGLLGGMIKLHSLRVDRQFKRIDDLNAEDVTKARLKDVQDMIKQLGGESTVALLPVFNTKALGASKDQLSANAYAPPADFKEDFLKKVGQYLDRPDVKTFVGMDGKTYDLSKDEIEYIKSYAVKYAEKYAQIMMTSSLMALKNASLDLEVKATKGNLGKDNISEEMESRIAEITENVLVTQDGTEQIKYQTAQLLVPKFKYSQEERMAAAKALHAEQAPLPQWNQTKRNRIEKEVTDALSESLNVPNIWKIDAATYNGNRPFQLWLEKNDAVEKALK